MPTEPIRTIAAIERSQLATENASESHNRFRVQHIAAGRIRGAANRPGRYVVEPDALAAAVAAGLFENLSMFIDHAGWFENSSLRNLAARTISAEYNHDTQTVTGEIETLDTEAGRLVADLLNQILSLPETERPDIGLSLVFYPIFAETDDADLPRISGIEHIESSDFVFQPAAEGRILERLSALFQKETPTMTEPVTTPAEPVAESPNAAASQWSEALTASAVTAMLRNAELPEPTRRRLATGRYDTPEQLTAAITAATDELAALSAESIIDLGTDQPPRDPRIALGMSGFEEFSNAYEALMLGTRPSNGVRPLSGIREAYLMLSGDYELTGRFQDARVMFANVTTATMANLTADVLNKRVVNMFQQYPKWWDPIVEEHDFNSLQDVKWLTLGGVGELPTVAEGAAYTEMTWDDQRETSAFVKKGGYLGITIEAIDKDDTRKLQSAPRALSQAAWMTLNKAVSSIFTSNSGVGPTMSDSKALFHADHNNVGTTALSYAAWEATRAAMRQQTELNSAERLGALTAPKYLLVPSELEGAALQLLLSEGEVGTANNDENPWAEGGTREARLAAAQRRVIVPDMWTDANNWAAIANPMLYPSLAVGYRYGRNPEIFSVASPTAGLMFTNDVMPIKVRWFYAAGATDWRGLYKHNVA